MYTILIFLHSLFRWLVVLSLLYAVFRAYKGYRSRRTFSKTDDRMRHWTATIAHIQLMIGMAVYTQSPLIKYFWKHPRQVATHHFDALFYGMIHALGMLLAIVLITIGSAMARRKADSAGKFRTMLLWFSLACIIIILFVPWPFSPLSKRPYLR
ncbi:MAG: hypothetical protein EOP49_06120 [Sphingobacteriales bacterium]|nr:MAG: hypothetical protein EOP49_06120 [Sphingobacteriales bacterium]